VAEACPWRALEEDAVREALKKAPPGTTKRETARAE
jgi:hypothetical protein